MWQHSTIQVSYIVFSLRIIVAACVFVKFYFIPHCNAYSTNEVDEVFGT